MTRADDTTVDSQFQPYHDGLAEHVDTDQILDIVGIIINMNIWTRLEVAERAMPA